MSKSNSDELRERVYKICRNNKEYEASELIVELIQSEISKREQLLLSGLVKKAVYYTADKLEADGLDKWAVPVSFINAKRGKK